MSSGSPKAILDEAARQRCGCQLRVRRGSWTPGAFVRVDNSGVILKAEGLTLHGGEDVHVWFQHEGRTCTFDASVLRTGVPIPDRSSNGLLLGFIDSFVDGTDERPETDGGPELALEVLPPNGRGIDLFGPGCQIMVLGVDELTFSISRDQALKFVEGGRIRVRFRGVGEDLVATGRVQALSASDGHYLYGVHFEAVENPEHHVQVLEVFRQRVTP
ncbi:MAG: hypothetical protein GY913_08335 [Proteobacteria bacterium]|nr:hypothetical protein [Pseudomonadota bacterium]MCP4916917.1 hypothetical protein [Pseudomonadota bacterium]